MKIALFGGAGFIGVNLTRALAQQGGHDITVIDAREEFFAPLKQIGSGEEASTIQDLLNGIVPGLPVLLLFGVTYWLLKKKVNPLLIMLIMLVLGIAGAFFGFLG